MSAAVDFAPVPGGRERPVRRHLTLVPEQSPSGAHPVPARGWSRHDASEGWGAAPAVVVPLHRPSARSMAAPLRLTRRGVVVVATATGLLMLGLGLLAWRSAPSAPHSAPAPAQVTVRSGDTLWSIASHVAPGRDPRAEVASLQRLNHLEGVTLSPGQVLRVR